ncbi:hypothetical protein J437_LFUL017568 [Ladona fulva]|uniref:Uncharacterized protein n=1 Tax=Ladona fulva TaxID=123851 RepID=A0A8K0KNG4_LADFU|nr:hypothetical protein J437_LFUL017568 [Ladona fulva]
MKAKLGLVIFCLLNFVSNVLSAQVTEDAHNCPELCNCTPKNGNFKVKCQDKDLKYTSLEDFGVENLPTNTVLLNLSDNAITHLPRAGFGHLKILEKLDLRNNYIKVVEAQAFYNLTSLKRLDLSRNKVSVLNSSMFDGIPLLERLKLNENNITRIQGGAFNGLPKLKYL